MHAIDNAVLQLLTDPATVSKIEELKDRLNTSTDPFVWSVIDIKTLENLLPREIQSGWIFVLKKDVPSGAHYHPNSVQHMLLVEGQGRSCVSGEWREMELSDWTIIPQNTPHEFIPREQDMVVISFHTCLAEELEEIACETGQSRHYSESGPPD